MNKGEKQTAAAVVAVLAIVGFIVLDAGGYLTQFGVPKLFQQTPDTTVKPPVDQTSHDNYVNGIGKFQEDCRGFDSADPTTKLTIGSALDIQWYHFSGGHFTPDAGGYDPSVTNYFDAVSSDNGYAWIMVQAHSTSAYYIDYQKILSASPLSAGGYIAGYQYTDVDGDGQKEFVFEYSLKNQAIPSAGFPVASFSAYGITYETSTTLPHQTNLTGIGTSDTTKYIDWYEAQTTVKKGVAIYKVQLTVDTTDETKVRLKNMQIPGLGQVDVSSFDKTFTSTDIRYTYTFSNGFDGADYILYMPNTQNKNYFSTALEFNLPSGNVDVTLTLFTLIPPTEAGTSLTDVVNCAS
jgi:hypothetical protein